MKNNIVIVEGCRTAIGKFNGSLKDYEASDLGAIVIREVLSRAKLDPNSVDEVVMGCVGQIAENAFVARLAAIKGGIPSKSTALTVNRLCASGLQSIITATQEIKDNFCDIAIAGGCESMSNIPYYLRRARTGYVMGDGKLEDGLITALTDPFSNNPMGITAENIAKKYNISREEQDRWALISQQRAKKAQELEKFVDEIVPIEVKYNKFETRSFFEDEFIRLDSSKDKLMALRSAFKQDGTVTAGNSSGINDGAAVVVLMRETDAIKKGYKPLVKIIDYSVAGVDPDIMGIGPVPAIEKLLEKTNLKKEDIGLFELNEAFASQAIACIRELDIDENKVNVNGSGISLGHPIGATGAIITIKLINEMIRTRTRYGIASLCIGGGQGLAVLFELYDKN